MTAPTPPLRRIVLRGIGVTAAGQLATQALTLATYLVLARLAPPATFGAFAAAAILSNLGFLFVESGMSAAVIQYRGEIEPAAATAFVSTALGGLGLAALAAAAAPLVGAYFHNSTIGWVAFAVAGTHLVNALGIVPNALLQRRLAFRRRIFVDPASIVALGSVGIVGLSLGWGVWGLLAASYASVTARLVVLWALAAWWPQLRLASYALWRELIRFGRNILAGEILREGNRITVTALIGRFLGTAPLGEYNFGSRFATQTNSLVINSSSYVLFPTFSRLAHDEERFKRAFLRALRALSIAVMPVSLVFLPLGRPLCVLLLGEQWRAAGPVLMALCGLVAGTALASTSAEALKASGNSAATLHMTLVATVTNIGLVVALYRFGAAGVAAAASASAVVVGIYSLRRVSAQLGMRFGGLIAEIRAPVLAAAGMALGTLALAEKLPADRHSELAGLIVLASEGAFAGVLYLALLALQRPRDARNLLQAVRRRSGAGLTTS
jgi:O-antigen/teichoic acid export membrane protein